MGKELTTFEEDLDTAIMLSVIVVMAMVMMSKMMTNIITPIAQQLQAQAYQGMTDPRTVAADSNLKWLDVRHDFPYTPWISAYFIQDGPDPVEIGINYPDDRFTINPGETVTVSRSGAQERIAIIFYVCERGKKASVRITGEY